MKPIKHFCFLGCVLVLAILMVATTWDSGYCVWPDGASYAVAGRNLISGKGFVNIYGSLETIFPPFFPFLIGVFSLLVKNLELAARLVSASAGVLSVVLLYLLGRRIYSEEIGFLAAILFAFFPLRIALSQSILSESLYSLLILIAALLWLSWHRTGQFRMALTTGALLGLSYLTRPEGLIFAPLFTLHGLIFSSHTARNRLLGAGSVLGVFLLIAIPYVVFLHQATGKWQLTGKADFNLKVAVLRAGGVSWQRLKELDAAKTTIALPTEEELRQWPEAVKMSSLPRRYARNVFQEVDKLTKLLSPFALLLIGLGLFGRSWSRERLRDEAGLVCLLAPLVVLPVFFVEPRFLLSVVPVLLLWTAKGMGLLWEWAGALRERSRALQLASITLAMLLILPMFARNYRRDFHTAGYFTLGSGIASPHKVAGIWMRNNLPKGAIIAKTPAVAFYAEMRAIRMPYAPLEDTLTYAHHHGARYFVVTSADSDLHPSVYNLLQTTAAHPELQEIDVRNELPSWRGQIFLLR